MNRTAGMWRPSVQWAGGGTRLTVAQASGANRVTTPATVSGEIAEYKP